MPKAYWECTPYLHGFFFRAHERGPCSLLNPAAQPLPVSCFIKLPAPATSLVFQTRDLSESEGIHKVRLGPADESILGLGMAQSRLANWLHESRDDSTAASL
ncbi:hypothetical protein PCH_Pc18g04350 [Penicillium rubens Wisconsin 54-1255]|uniref:Uncharacterized protein n=1 Tax=Penicillium rubens (strain ATCC 28089 / DSM 1075 / NRRL 1951 / Wisconsin 54-1255) TaxID=500485 RepID=B6HBK3_PENRW|nr:hypothetical protein PCH_Pc18g04350 [Penicillium rubens Wisconsin 54-1255]